MRQHSLKRFAALLVLVLLGACTLPWEREQPQINYYVLSALPHSAHPQSATVSDREISVGVAPGNIPKYLDRSGIVTRTSANEISVADLHLWGSPLLTQIETTLATNLRISIPTNRVTVLPFRGALRIKYEIGFIIDRFERLADGTVVLDARWAIEGRAKNGDPKLLDVGEVALTETSVPEEYPAIVAAMSRLIGTFSGQIADDIRILEGIRT